METIEVQNTDILSACPECRSQLITDHGILICTSCGLVQDEIVFEDKTPRSEIKNEFENLHHESVFTPLSHTEISGGVITLITPSEKNNKSFNTLKTTELFFSQQSRDIMTREIIATNVFKRVWEYFTDEYNLVIPDIHIPTSVIHIAKKYYAIVIKNISWEINKYNRTYYGYAIASLYLASRIELPILKIDMFKKILIKIEEDVVNEYTSDRNKLPLKYYVRKVKAVTNFNKKSKDYESIINNIMKVQLTSEKSSYYQLFSDDSSKYCNIKTLACYLVKRWIKEGRKYSDSYLPITAIKFASYILSKNKMVLRSYNNSTTLISWKKAFEFWLGIRVHLKRNDNSNALNRVIPINPSPFFKQIIRDAKLLF